MPPEPPAFLAVPLSWVGYDETPILFANQFLIQFQPDGSFVLGVGQANAPPLLGTPEEIVEQAADITFVPVRTLLRCALTEAKLREVVQMLSANLEKFERARTESDPRNQE